MHGIVESYSTDKGHGWIRGEDGIRYFVHQRHVVMNHLYLRYLDVNELVVFVPSFDTNRRRKNAVNVTVQNRPQEVMPYEYWELGTILHLGTDGTGWIQRWLPNEAIFFTTYDVVTYGPVEVGTRVVFNFKHDDLGRLKASNVEICLPEVDISEYMVYE